MLNNGQHLVFIRRVSEHLLLVQKLLERLLMKRKGSYDEIYSHSVILFTKFKLLCGKYIWVFLVIFLHLISKNNGVAEKFKKIKNL
jgi:membrane-bound acyltransferase YfiQ involved in biofilm formation